MTWKPPGEVKLSMRNGTDDAGLGEGGWMLAGRKSESGVAVSVASVPPVIIAEPERNVDADEDLVAGAEAGSVGITWDLGVVGLGSLWVEWGWVDSGNSWTSRAANAFARGGGLGEVGMAGEGLGEVCIADGDS